jgi:8-oxo-dGTP diphosphatase
LGESAIVTARLAVTDPNTGKILVAKRLPGSNPHTLDAWELPGGKPDEGESLQVAACREVREETGVDVAVVSPFVLYDSYMIKDGKHTGRHLVAYAAEAMLLAGEARPVSEVEAVAWLSPQEMYAFPTFRPGTHQLLAALGIEHT